MTFAGHHHQGAGWTSGGTIRAYWIRAWMLVAVLLYGISDVMATEPPDPVTGAARPSPRGLPFIRRYSFEEIGNGSRGGRLSFDPFGRLAIVQNGGYLVLNDSNWMDIANWGVRGSNVTDVIRAPDGSNYFFSYGEWGFAEFGPDGKLRLKSVPWPAHPGWVERTNYTDYVVNSEGVFFYGYNGLVFLSGPTAKPQFFEVPALSRAFVCGGRVYVSNIGNPIRWVDVVSGALRPIEITEPVEIVVDQAAPLDNEHTLCTTRGGRMYVFDGAHLTPWHPQQQHDLSGRVTTVCALQNGAVALAIGGRGLYLVSREGELTLSLRNPEYQGITNLVTNEPGVLWAKAEEGIVKILYGKPVSRFGQTTGLPISWPLIARWGDTWVVTSGGTLYESASTDSGEPTRFHEFPNQPSTIWSVVVAQNELLVGGDQGVYAVGRNGAFRLVAPSIAVVRLIMVSETECLALGAADIAALRLKDGEWTECAQRVRSPGFPSIAHTANNAVWVELGANRAARITLRDGRIVSRVVDRFPWKNPHWVNIGTMGDTTILAGPPEGRLYFNEKTEEFCDAPDVKKILEGSPFWIQRVCVDSRGVIWATYDYGVMNIRLTDGGPVYEATSLSMVFDRTPLIFLVGGDDVWISTGYSLFHVDDRGVARNLGSARPTLVTAVSGGRSGSGEFSLSSMVGRWNVPAGADFLRFRFFAGTYALYKNPEYEFRLNTQGNTWSPLGADSLLNFSGLAPGDHHLEVRLTDNAGPYGTPASFDFTIPSPWYRTTFAFAGYVLTGMLAIYGLVRWSGRRAQTRNAELEALVKDRTSELQTTMQRLNEETHNAATLAERNRLAGEIHDSLQQGLSGLMLQLDATLKQSALTPDVRERLTVARNMVSFTRHEVQHAVWDKESPLLEGTDLEHALRKMVDLICTGGLEVNFIKRGESIEIGSADQHQLLRIGQEAITNVVRHAEAKALKIELEYSESGVSLTVSDDGKGFDVNGVLENGVGHFGLRGLRARVAQIGGQLSIQSRRGSGTCLRVSVRLVKPATPPLHADNPAS